MRFKRLIRMSESKKRGREIVDDEQCEIPHADIMKEFGEIISQSVLEENINQIESFELYVHHLRSHIHSDVNGFRLRFSEGYRILIEELEKEPI